MSSDPIVMKLVEENKALLLRLGELQDQLRQRDEIIDTEHQQTERQKQRAIDAECRLGSCEQALADIRHAWEHANEIGRMDHYAANTIKQALSSGTAPARHADGSAKAAPSQWWCPTHGGLIDKGQPCLDGCVESDFAVERRNGFD
jgi:hypothetical protein